uniref:Fibrinogen alpha/beta/gamma chain coiled coil domain-containing protein n=2 Tax=Poecilia mexicana TaxID=48701 RepID=A0A3B3WM05_9TELE
MKKLSLLLCLVSVALTQAALLDPRGARPVEPSTRDEKCATQKEWPFCTDDDWYSKCPSGCRIQGLMDKNDHELLKKIEKIRSLLDQHKARHRSVDLVSKQTYDILTERLTLDTGNDNMYYNLAQTLRQRISEMKVRIDRQQKALAALKDRVKEQVVEMQKLEVDIDIKLRSCKGSCGGHTEYQVDRESYVALDKQVNQLDAQTARSVETVGTLYVMKSRPLQDVIVDSRFKSKDVAAQRTEDVFPQVNTVQFILEEEGSSSSPATVSKVPVCQRFKQQKQDGRRSASGTNTYRMQRCSAGSHLSLCSDDDWVSKCPSGCRLQGLMSEMENEVEKKLQTFCQKSSIYEIAMEKSMTEMTHVYNSNRRVMVNRYISELKFVESADKLAKNLRELRRRSGFLAQKIKEMSSHVRKQVEELYRTEVDIDMKLRTCQGSCRAALPFSVDHHGYQSLQTDLRLMDKTMTQKTKPSTPPQNIPRVTLQPANVGPPPSAEYKKIPTVQKELLTQFEDIEQNRMVLVDQSDQVNTLRAAGSNLEPTAEGDHCSNT